MGRVAMMMVNRVGVVVSTKVGYWQVNGDENGGGKEKKRRVRVFDV